MFFCKAPIHTFLTKVNHDRTIFLAALVSSSHRLVLLRQHANTRHNPSHYRQPRHIHLYATSQSPTSLSPPAARLCQSCILISSQSPPSILLTPTKNKDTTVAVHISHPFSFGLSIFAVGQPVGRMAAIPSVVQEYLLTSYDFPLPWLSQQDTRYFWCLSPVTQTCYCHPVECRTAGELRCFFVG